MRTCPRCGVDVTAVVASCDVMPSTTDLARTMVTRKSLTVSPCGEVFRDGDADAVLLNFRWADEA